MVTYKTTISNMDAENMADVFTWLVSTKDYMEFITEESCDEVVIADEQGVVSASVKTINVQTYPNKDVSVTITLSHLDECGDKIYIFIGEWLCFTKEDCLDRYEEVSFVLESSEILQDGTLHEIIQLILSNDKQHMEIYPSSASRLYAGEITDRDFEIGGVSVVKNTSSYITGGAYTLSVSVLIPARLLMNVYELTLTVTTDWIYAKLVGAVI